MSGLFIAIVRPSKAFPASRRNYFSLKFFHFGGFVNVSGPESSLIPKQFMRKKFMFRKKSLVDSLIGAAEKTKNSHLSRPKFYLILLKTNFLASPQNAGNGPPLISAYVPYCDLLLAQSAIFLFKPVV
jgi:hypothetical protein